MMKIPESDWKKLTIIRAKALNRYYSRVLDRVQAILDRRDNENMRQIYLDTYKRINEDDKVLVVDFGQWSRSNAYYSLMAWVNLGLVTRAEHDSLSEQTQLTSWNLDEVDFYVEDGD